MIPNNYPYFNQMQQFGQNLPTQQMQNNGFVMVRSEEEARNFPVGFGNSVTFKDETSPYMYCKTMGFSQLDKPIFEKFRLTKEESEGEEAKKECQCNGLKAQLSELEAQITSLWDEIDYLRKKRRDNEHSSNGKSNQTKSDGGSVAEV